MASEQNHYEALGLVPGASAQAVTEAYRRLVTLYHEDRRALLPPDERAEARARFDEVLAAYRVLGKPESRVLYDEQFLPPRTVRELLLGPSGKRLMEMLLPRPGDEPTPGEDLVAAAAPPDSADPRVLLEDGPFSVPLPKGGPRRWLRLAGRGVPGSNGATDGYLYICFRDDVGG